MTNFEYYKDKILEITDNGEDICITNGKLSSCNGLDICDCCDWCEKDIIKDDPCTAMKYKWLYAEHIDKPKLTKRERSFCELIETGWLAADRDNHWYHHSEKPKKSESRWCSDKVTGFKILFNDLNFNFIKWEDKEPWSISDLLKLDVIEE